MKQTYNELQITPFGEYNLFADFILTLTNEAIEECDGIDNNCSGEIDEDVGDVYFVDRDRDGFGDDNDTVLMCEWSIGFAEVGGDCDDGNSTFFRRL